MSSHPEPDDASHGPLPLTYGEDRLVLMVRDPASARAYWETGGTLIDEAVSSLGGGEAFLRLRGVRTGRVLAEHETRARPGRPISGPQPGSAREI